MIGLLILIIIVGLLVYLVQTLPIPKPFKVAAYVVGVLIILIAVLNGLGYVGGPIVVRD
jgi:hypothetical protein